MGDPLEVIIAVGARIYREGLVEAVQRRDNVVVAAAVATSAEAIGAVERCRARVVLFDISLPGATGAVQYLASGRQRVPVVAMSINDTVADVHAWAALGVAGFVTTDDSLDDLTQCITTVACGEFRCSPRHASMLLRRVAALSRQGTPLDPADGLTPRQAEVGALLRTGISNKLIARQLGIELATVKNHVHEVLRRLHMRSRGELLRASLPASFDHPRSTDG
jgi:DNA-binding NarL/FixJ family response regulator